MAKKITSTILRVYLLDKSRPRLEEGIIRLCNENGKVTKHEIHFDSLSDVPDKIRELLRDAGIQWPRR